MRPRQAEAQQTTMFCCCCCGGTPTLVHLLFRYFRSLLCLSCRSGEESPRGETLIPHQPALIPHQPVAGPRERSRVRWFDTGDRRRRRQAITRGGLRNIIMTQLRPELPMTPEAYQDWRRQLWSQRGPNVVTPTYDALLPCYKAALERCQQLAAKLEAPTRLLPSRGLHLARRKRPNAIAPSRGCDGHPSRRSRPEGR